MNMCGLFILWIGACVTNVGISEGDNLAAVGRVSDDFLVTRQRGVENNFTDLCGGGAKGNALEHCAIRERKQGAR